MKDKSVKHLVYRWKQKIVPYGKTRHSTQYVKEQNNGELLTVCELGVFKGYNARNLLKTLPIKKLYLVDIYKPFDYIGELNTGYLDGYVLAKKRLSHFNNVEFIIDDCIEVSKKINDTFDFIYYDASPNYDMVFNSLNVWFPKLKVGGIFGGRGATFFTLCEIKAVIDFSKDRDDCIVGGKANEWWITKGLIGVKK